MFFSMIKMLTFVSAGSDEKVKNEASPLVGSSSDAATEARQSVTCRRHE